MKKIVIIVVGVALVLMRVPAYAARSSLIAASPITEPIEITSPGAYKLANNITGQIKISANNVSFDLNNYAITGSETHAILVSPGVRHIEIENGNIEDVTAGSAIEISAGCQDVVIRYIHTHQCLRGISATQSVSIVINQCVIFGGTEEGIKLDTCSLCILISTCPIQCRVGIYLLNTNGVHMRECGSVGNSYAGFHLSNAQRCALMGCTSIQTGPASVTDSYGYLAENGGHNIFLNCIGEGTGTLATEATNIAAGVCFKGTEESSEVHNCYISNSSTPADHLAKAYGIVLLETFSTLGDEVNVDRSAAVNSLSWFPDANYLATAGPVVQGSCEVEIAEYNSVHSTLTLRDAVSHGATVNAVAWSSDSRYLAAGGATGTDSKEVRLYYLDQEHKSLTLCDSAAHGAAINSVAFSPDSRFLAVGGATSSTYQIRVYEINHIAKTLKLVDSVARGAEVKSLSWSPSSSFLVVGGVATEGSEIQLYEMSLYTKALTLRDSLAHGATINSVGWSACEPYLAAGGAVNGSGKDTIFIGFDSTTKTLTSYDTKAHGAAVNSISWSPRNYIVTGGATGTDDKEIRAYLVDPTTNTISLQDSQTHGDTVNSVSWAAGGSHVAAGGAVTSSVSHRVFTGLQAPTKCTISKNIVHNIHGCLYKMSSGISAPGLTNFITANKCYDCDQNYLYVTNVYEGSMNGNPGLLQNVSI